MWALIVICVGMLFDTILPAFGITAIPSSTIGQAIGIFIIYSGLDFNKQNRIDIDNISHEILYENLTEEEVKKRICIKMVDLRCYAKI